MVAHSEYRQLDLEKLRAALRLPVLVDGRRLYDNEGVMNAGLGYRCIGQAFLAG